MPSQYTLTVYLVGGDRTRIQDLTVRMFTDGARWDEIRKALVGSYTEKVRFRMPRGDFQLHISCLRDGEFWETPFWGFPIPQVPEVRINMDTGWVILPDQKDRAAIAQQWIKQKDPPTELRDRTISPQKI